MVPPRSYRDSINFDDALPQYETQNGMVRADDGSGVVTSPVAMWLEARAAARARSEMMERRGGRGRDALQDVGGGGRGAPTSEGKRTVVAVGPRVVVGEALELGFERLVAADGGTMVKTVGAISASAQQHGSVFWAKGGLERLAKRETSLKVRGAPSSFSATSLSLGGRDQPGGTKRK